MIEAFFWNIGGKRLHFDDFQQRSDAVSGHGRVYIRIVRRQWRGQLKFARHMPVLDELRLKYTWMDGVLPLS